MLLFIGVLFLRDIRLRAAVEPVSRTIGLITRFVPALLSDEKHLCCLELRHFAHREIAVRDFAQTTFRAASARDFALSAEQVRSRASVGSSSGCPTSQFAPTDPKLRNFQRQAGMARSRDATVVVVDDDISVREALSGLIHSVGLRVETFSTAAEFLRRPRPAEPSCVVLDVGLLDLSGIELQQELAATRRLIPIIFITGQGHSNDREGDESRGNRGFAKAVPRAGPSGFHRASTRSGSRAARPPHGNRSICMPATKR